MNKKKKFQLKSKHLLFIMTFLCLSGILGSAADKMPEETQETSCIEIKF